jgi:hypothetical protein
MEGMDKITKIAVKCCGAVADSRNSRHLPFADPVPNIDRGRTFGCHSLPSYQIYLPSVPSTISSNQACYNSCARPIQLVHLSVY